MKYNHLQINKIGIAALLIGSVFGIWSAWAKEYTDYVPDWINTTGWNIWAVLIISVIYIIAINMMMMRIRISKTEIIWSFGIGFPIKRIRLEDISQYEKVTNKWWYGWGIRKVVSGGWLYNVYGLQAIEIHTHQGKIVRLGTDEPKKLYRVLDNVLKQHHKEGDCG